MVLPHAPGRRPAPDALHGRAQGQGLEPGVWAALVFAGVFITVHVLLAPTSGYVGQTETEVAVDVVVFLVFCAISGYFRYRPERWKPHPAR